MDLTFLPDRLLPWFRDHARDLPWRQDREPYHVWLSEVMLQQTRVEAVKNYYARFLAALPTVEALAQAPEQQLLRLWEGLGYYSRVRNLQKAAQIITDTLGGVFPADLAGWRALPGVGDYTAGAVCSICYGLPTPAVDGNVLRVYARLTLLEDAVDEPAVKKRITRALAQLYPAGQCGDFTQALMELGATVCVPNGAPDCGRCPVADLCGARREERWAQLPVKTPKKARTVQERTVLLLEFGDTLGFEKRPDTGLLAGQWQLPNREGTLTPQQALDWAAELGARPEALLGSLSRTHVFTHLEWHMTGYRIRCGAVGPGLTAARPGELPLPSAFKVLLKK